MIGRTCSHLRVSRLTSHNGLSRCSRRGMKTSGVIFDMDGTLTEENAIDFQAMYDRIGIKKKGDSIIEQIKKEVPPGLQKKAFDIVQDEEMRACERMILKNDLQQCIDYLTGRNIKLAISTRNCRAAYDAFAKRITFCPTTFYPVLSRESLNGVNKPDPRVARHILKTWGQTSPNEVWFVGDTIDDIRCGKWAGCNTCLVTTSRTPLVDEHLADFRVSSLLDFVNVLSDFEVQKPVPVAA